MVETDSARGCSVDAVDCPVGFSVDHLSIERPPQPLMIRREAPPLLPVSQPCRQLPDLHAGTGHGIEPAGREALVAMEESVDRIILLDLAIAGVEIDDASIKRERLVK